MDHADHVRLLRSGVVATDLEPGSSTGVRWADLGSGSGAFTLALADLLGEQAALYSIDRDRSALATQERVMRLRFPAATVYYRVGDFTGPLDFPPLDGIVMANALHVVARKGPVLKLIWSYLKADGRLILVEYNTDRGNRWVPYPLSFPAWRKLASRCGFRDTTVLATAPSRFLGQIYAASSRKSEEARNAL